MSTQGEVYRTADFLEAYVLEWTLHHLDLIAHLPGAADPPPESLARSRAMLESAVDRTFPADMPDVDVLRVGTGRRHPTDEDRARLGPLASELPFVVG